MISRNVALPQPMKLADILDAVEMGYSIFFQFFSPYLGFLRSRLIFSQRVMDARGPTRIAQVEVHLGTIKLIFPLLFTSIEF
jgi:hypothetical protein